MTIAQSAVFISWAALDFAPGHAAAGQAGWAREAVQWAADYLAACHLAPNATANGTDAGANSTAQAPAESFVGLVSGGCARVAAGGGCCRAAHLRLHTRNPQLTRPAVLRRWAIPTSTTSSGGGRRSSGGPAPCTFGPAPSRRPTCWARCTCRWLGGGCCAIAACRLGPLFACCPAPVSRWLYVLHPRRPACPRPIPQVAAALASASLVLAPHNASAAQRYLQHAERLYAWGAAAPGFYSKSMPAYPW